MTVPVDDLIAEAMKNAPDITQEELNRRIGELLRKRAKDQERAEEIMKILEIPYRKSSSFQEGDMVSVTVLLDILLDDKKCQTLFSKLRNKAFW